MMNLRDIRGIKKRQSPLLSGFVIGLVLILSCPEVGLARKRGKPPTREEIAQTWVGLSADGLYLLRMTLTSDGTGLGGYVFRGSEPKTFTISHWAYHEGRISIIAVPPEVEESWVRPLHGNIVGLAMEVTAKGEDWAIVFSLRQEAELEAMWLKLKASMPAKTDHDR